MLQKQRLSGLCRERSGGIAASKREIVKLTLNTDSLRIVNSNAIHRVTGKRAVHLNRAGSK